MLVLGISDSHNSSACVYEHGHLVAAISEERLRRVKNWMGFPEQAIRECLRLAGRRLEDVDYVALAGLACPFPYPSRQAIIDTFSHTRSGMHSWLWKTRQALVQGMYKGRLRDLYRATPLWRMRHRERWRRRVTPLLALGVPEEKIGLVEHHLAHASSAYYGWGRFDEDILVLTNDGGGDGLCATVNIGHKGHLRRLAEVDGAESIGMVYGMATCVLGMVPLEHEYKLMGMAPYADTAGAEKVCRDLQQLFGFDGPDGMVWSRRRSCPETYNSYRYFRDLFERQRFDWVCGGLQRFTEAFTTEWVRHCIRATGIHKVALSGGVFMNVKLNKAIMELPEVHDLFVFPSCGDETNAMGAAYSAYAQQGQYRSMQPLRDLYLGREYDEGQVSQAIKDFPFTHRVAVQQTDGIEEAVAELLAQGDVVARFKGREEFGARAMGNRSLLACAAKPEVVTTINDAIKARDFWMPFAPSLLDYRQADYYVDPKHVAAPYMILSFDATTHVDEFRAACHPYDSTLRPQVVYQDWNPDYYTLLSAFERLTGRGICLNTSFNLHGYPIVSKPQDALQVFDTSGLQWLAIGNHLLHKHVGSL